VEVHRRCRQWGVDRVIVSASEPILLQRLFVLQMSDAGLDRGAEFDGFSCRCVSFRRLDTVRPGHRHRRNGITDVAVVPPAGRSRQERSKGRGRASVHSQGFSEVSLAQNLTEV
jgi:hypothetical protein